MRYGWSGLGTVLLAGLGLALPSAAISQEVTAADLEEWIRSGYEFNWEAGQQMPDEVRAVWSQLGSGGVGYGFRTFDVRTGPPDSVPRMTTWRVTLNELNTSVVGEIGLAWGVHVEEFTEQGKPRRVVRVRFTNTLRWDGQRWVSLLYHRDAQEFPDE